MASIEWSTHTDTLRVEPSVFSNPDEDKKVLVCVLRERTRPHDIGPHHVEESRTLDCCTWMSPTKACLLGEALIKAANYWKINQR
jgi:hypothetical protein